MNEIGFVWDPYGDAWRRWFKELEAYKQENGHCNVPRSKGKLGKWVKLGQWVETQRNRPGKLSKEKIDALKEIGFVWDPCGDAWKLRFEELKAYKNKKGHCKVPAREGKLGRWVAEQRYAYNTQNKKHNLSKERIDALNEIGFEWSVQLEWRAEAANRQQARAELIRAKDRVRKSRKVGKLPHPEDLRLIHSNKDLRDPRARYI